MWRGKNCYPNRKCEFTLNITREEYEELKEQYETIITKLNVFLTPVTTEKPTRRTKEVKDDE